MNTFKVSGTVTTTINGSTQSQPINSTLSITSSLGVNGGQLIPTGSWVQLTTGSMAKFRIGVFTNNDPTASILLALNSTGSYPITLLPSDDVLITNGTGSVMPIWATATRPIGNYSASILNYTISDN